MVAKYAAGRLVSSPPQFFNLRVREEQLKKRKTFSLLLNQFLILLMVL